LAVGLQFTTTDFGSYLYKEFHAILKFHSWYYYTFLIFIFSFLRKKRSFEGYLQLICIGLIYWYVTFTMGAATGNYIMYTTHILTPFLTFMLYSTKEKLDRIIIGVTTIALISWAWQIFPPRTFGMLEQKVVIKNNHTIEKVKEVLQEYQGKKLLVSMLFSHIAYDYSYDFVDSGHRRNISAWNHTKNALEKHPIFQYFKWHELDIKETYFLARQPDNDYVLCALHCRTLNKNFVDSEREIGTIQTARNRPMDVRLFVRKSIQKVE
ncbi:MAG: hypothetical protein QNL04_07855, partial [SAR324 cluster bacterium]|nr:hypothetical protein [SAR324 cluster bacterium]